METQRKMVRPLLPHWPIIPCIGPRKIGCLVRSTGGIFLSSRHKKEKKGGDQENTQHWGLFLGDCKPGRSWGQSPLHGALLSPPPRPPPTTLKPPSSLCSSESNLRTSAHLTLLEQLFETTGTFDDGLELEESLHHWQSPETGKAPGRDWMGRRKNRRVVWLAAKAVTGMVPSSGSTGRSGSTWVLFVLENAFTLQIVSLQRNFENINWRLP